MINFAKFNSLVAIVQYLDTLKKCKEAIVQYRWTDGDVVCIAAGITATPAATAGISAASATRVFPAWWEPYSRTPR